MNRFASLMPYKRLLECRPFATKKVTAEGKDISKKKVFLTADGKEVPKKKEWENRVTLIGMDDSITITSLVNAQSISERRDLKLVKIQDEDTKTRRPVYKLMTSSQYHEEELKSRKEKQQNRTSQLKGVKLLTIASKIAQNDLQTNIKKMMKLVEKQYEVRIVITGDGSEGSSKLEDIYLTIEKNVKSSSRVLQKRMKGNALKFQLTPLKTSSTDSPNNLDKNKNDSNKGPL